MTWLDMGIMIYFIRVCFLLFQINGVRLLNQTVGKDKKEYQRYNCIAVYLLREQNTPIDYPSGHLITLYFKSFLQYTTKKRDITPLYRYKFLMSLFARVIEWCRVDENCTRIVSMWNRGLWLVNFSLTSITTYATSRKVYSTHANRRLHREQ